MKNKYILVVLVVLFSLASKADAAMPSDFGLKEGDLISAIFSDDPDVYIINEHGYKRLFLNPEIFNFYGHLGGFAKVSLVTPEIRDAFTTSTLFRDCETNDPKVYGVEVKAEDTGNLRWIDVSGDQAVKDDPEFFKKVFCINNKELDWYPKGESLTAVNEVPSYSRGGSSATPAEPAVPAEPAAPASPSQPFASPTPTPASGATGAIPATPATPAIPPTPASPSFTPTPTPVPTPTPTPNPTPTPTPISTSAPACISDTDVSIRYGLQGSVTFSSGTYYDQYGGGYIATSGGTLDDICVDPAVIGAGVNLRETYCDGNSTSPGWPQNAFLQVSYVYCSYGCSNGACNPDP